MNKIQKVINIFDRIIEEAIGNLEFADEILINTYTSFRENIKKRKGTGSGFTGFIEYLYFEFIKKYFQKKLPIAPFKNIQSSIGSGSPVYIFKSQNEKVSVILSSDIYIGKEKHIDIKLFDSNLRQNMYIKPDVFIGLDNNKEIIPIAFIEVKLNLSIHDFEVNVIHRFKNIIKWLGKEKSKELPYFICLLIEVPRTLDKKVNEYKKIIPN